MDIVADQMSAARGHIELVLLSSRTDELDKDAQFLRLTNRGMPRELVSGLDDLWDLTRACGGHVIRVGRIVVAKVLEFVDMYPETNVGMSISAAVRAFSEMVPILGPTLAPITVIVAGHRFGGCFDGTDYEEKLHRSAQGFIKLTAQVFNVNSHFFQVLDDMDPDFESFEQYTMNDLSEEENPFDLEDISGLSEENELAAKYLIKIALTEGAFDASEQLFVMKTVESLGETLSPEQLDKLTDETSRQSLETILAGSEKLPVEYKERLLLLGMLTAGADNRIDVKEKKLLAQSLPILKISKKRYSKIAREALVIIKSDQGPAKLSNHCRMAVKYLVRMMLLQGALNEKEMQFIRQAVRKLGEVVAEKDLLELVTEASQQSLKDILAHAKELPERFRHKLLFMAMVAATMDGSVDTGEKKAFAESFQLLGISKEKYAQIANKVMAKVRAGSRPLA